MGLPYSIISLVCIFFIVLAFAIWSTEGWRDKTEKKATLAIFAGFVVAAVALWYVVKAILASEQ